ncbi:MAG: glutamyl-tRNA reductase [Thermoanaerobaculia bacterium]
MYNLFCVGLNYKTAPLEVREKLAIPNERFLDFIISLKGENKISGGVWLYTCNRSEFYFTSEEKVEREVLSYVLKKVGDLKVSEEYFYILRDLSVVEHLFFVVSSLDSMVVGEPQILGQVKDAYEFFLKKGATNTLLNELFQVSLKVGKKVRTETNIGEGAVSVPYVAVELAKKVFENLEELEVLFIGAGEMAEISLMHLKENGVKRIVVLNRTEEKAEELAEKFKGEGYSLKMKEEFLSRADLVITCTSSQEPIIKMEDFKGFFKKRKYRPIIIIDMAVPPDVEKEVSQLEGCFLYNIDDLNAIAEENRKQREESIFEAEKIIFEEIKKFQNRWEVLKIAPFIQEIRDYIWNLKREEMEKLFKKSPDFNEKQKKEIEIFADGLLQKILHPFFEEVKKVKPKKGAQNLIKRFLGLGKL